MNRKKQKLIEIFFITFFFFIFIILFQLQSFVIVILLVASLTISLHFKNDIIEIILPKKKNFLYFIFFDIFLIISMIKLFGDDFFLNDLDLKKYYFTSVLLLFYLLFSVIPQEIIFRFLFFYKYKDYFNKFEILLLNSLVFSFCHLIYFDIYILLFSFFGNLLFTFNYMKNKSLLVVIVEHFLLGQTLIILGFFDNFNFSLIKKLYNLVLIN
ncbi:MAG: hypothetical protein CM15mP67_12130 [Alphaproteobacteria bacterium]|nr:MAG: hypothetical protein CM15mP67_12130 [Alphaproteobacteria bacterium]